jgi:hypothetical protein
MTRLLSRGRTVIELFAHFAAKEKLFLFPLLLILLMAAGLLLATGGLSYVAPFVYALF